MVTSKVQELTCPYGHPCKEMQLHTLLEVHSDTYNGVVLKCTYIINSFDILPVTFSLL